MAPRHEQYQIMHRQCNSYHNHNSLYDEARYGQNLRQEQWSKFDNYSADELVKNLHHLQDDFIDVKSCRRSRKIYYCGKFRTVAIRTKPKVGLINSKIRSCGGLSTTLMRKVVHHGEVFDIRSEKEQLAEKIRSLKLPEALMRNKADFDRFADMIETKGKKSALLSMFRLLYSSVKKSGEGKPSKRIDFEAWEIMKQNGLVPKYARLFGPIAGVDIQDEFECRLELVLVGLHLQPFHGIDYVTLPNGRILASSVVATDGYLDFMMKPDVLIYRGEGGTFEVNANSAIKDQELKRGNLALKNSIEEGNFVRVVRGVKVNFGLLNSKSGSKRPIFVYDGLFQVVKHEKVMGPYGKLIFQFQLKRCAGQRPIVWEKYR